MFCILKFYSLVLILQTLLLKNHILYIILILIVCSIISSSIFIIGLTSWLRLIIIIVYIRGIIVLFIFVVSLIPNEKRTMKNEKIIAASVLLNTALLIEIKTIKIEKFKICSRYFINKETILIITTIILISAYLPPIFLIKIFKGIKSSK